MQTQSEYSNCFPFEKEENYENVLPKFSFKNFELFLLENKQKGEISINTKDIYLIKREDFKERKKLFTTSNESRTSKTQYLVKKRGRKRQKSSIKKSKTHDKLSEENIIRKIQVHFMSFIISFLNDIIKNFNYKDKFLELPYDFKGKITKINLESLKRKTLADIICHEISSRYSKHINNENSIIYKNIKDNDFNKIFNYNIKDLYNNIYYKGLKNINLNYFGINKDKEIILSNNVKMLNDLLVKNSSEEEYVKKIKFYSMQYLN